MPQLTCVGPGGRSGPWKRLLYMGCQDRGVVIGQQAGNGDGLDPALKLSFHFPLRVILDSFQTDSNNCQNIISSSNILVIIKSAVKIPTNPFLLHLHNLANLITGSYGILKCCVSILPLSLLRPPAQIHQMVPSHNLGTLLQRHHNYGNLLLPMPLALL